MKLKIAASSFGAVSVLLAFLFPPSVQAAAELSRSIPAPGSDVSEPPDSLELSFTQDIEEATLTLNGSELEVELDDERVTASVETLDEGSYTVEWTVRSEVDRNETSGSFQFSVRAEETGEPPPDIDPEARAERVDEVGDDNRTEVLLWTSLGIAVIAVLAFIFFYFRTSIPTFGTSGIEGGLPPPGQSPPEHEEDGDGSH